ncbi:RsmB/NOP family class I SAM-dependent RNA methyltransferase [Erythrobacter sp. JK5]|uniref:RsmB/NOP family class I SAM-dependent RNA methyltransferase n=1 Tax=Erythrobacter sp. JK5 TaxID=2829500 RepID=UPI001BA625FE|nr:RsmB/NOP family class I SAM-dependent RNA methyltransferase [Erythrobacter sp. JK5]QUL38557.1 RsmB/NOP family class I SAM-dependent RNA methyltransferase [Erythrobacter sp. JK5]
MTPAARVQAAIELLDAIIDAAKHEGAPADRLIAEWARNNRYAGSKDRRAVRELVYSAIRVCGPVPESGRAAMGALGAAAPETEHILQLFDGSNYGPAPLASGEVLAEPGIAPGWLVERFAASGIVGDALEALMERAPLDIRVNALKADRATIDLPEQGEPLAAPQALRFDSGTQVEQWPAWRDGLIEVQDLGSQIACEAMPVRESDLVIDLCAGAGGKTLALAARSGNAATLVAADTDARRLGNLAPRALRAGAQIASTVLLNPGQELEALAEWHGKADLVLVDAPCSGTGTWRRKPEAKWRLTPDRLDRFAALQDRLLDIASRLVRLGGRIGYVTCSLLDQEGADRVAAFLARNAGWQSETGDLPLGRPHGAGMRLDPFHDGTDGFFIAILRSS